MNSNKLLLRNIKKLNTSKQISWVSKAAIKKRNGFEDARDVPWQINDAEIGRSGDTGGGHTRTTGNRYTAM